MRFLITAAADPEAPRDPQMNDVLFEAYMRFNEELHKAGVLVASEGLNPAGRGARIVVKNGKRTVVDGPFAESKELVGGLYILQVRSREEAIEWALKCPVGMGTDDVLTIHQMTDVEDIPPEYVRKIREVAPNWSRTFERKSG